MAISLSHCHGIASLKPKRRTQNCFNRNWNTLKKPKSRTPKTNDCNQTAEAAWISLIDVIILFGKWHFVSNERKKKSTPVILNRFEKHVSQSTFSTALPGEKRTQNTSLMERVAALLVSLSIAFTINYTQCHRITGHWHFCECNVIIIIYHKSPVVVVVVVAPSPPPLSHFVAIRRRFVYIQQALF